MKKILLSFVTLISLGLILIFGYYNYMLNKKEKYNQVLEIKRDVTLSTSLKDIEVTKTLPFKLYLKSQNGGRDIKAGYYELKGDFSIKELVTLLEKGHSKMTKVTIPDGYSFKNILKILSNNDKEKEKKIIEVLKEKDFPYPTPNKNFEGYFYPETYFIPVNYSEKEVVDVILNHFLTIFPPEKYENKEDFYKKLILASIIEREAVLKEEKPIISSVFYNRMKIGMVLGADSTVSYLYDYTKKRLYYKDLEIVSPYNTYKNKGLPPAPIASPNKESVEAAYNPANTDYLFFVAKGDGGHYFSRTYKEHLDFQKNNKK